MMMITGNSKFYQNHSKSLKTSKTHQKNYGKYTIEALNAGFVWGYEGLINNIIDKIISRSKIKYKILLTGGYANFFNKMIKKKVAIDQDITIKG